MKSLLSRCSVWSVVAASLAAFATSACIKAPDGTYCECAEHDKPDRCVTLKQNGENLDIELEVDGQAAGSLSAKYTVENGYGRADTDMGPFVVSLVRMVPGLGKPATSARFEGDRAGVFNFSGLKYGQTCR